MWQSWMKPNPNILVDDLFRILYISRVVSFIVNILFCFEYKPIQDIISFKILNEILFNILN